MQTRYYTQNDAFCVHAERHGQIIQIYSGGIGNPHERPNETDFQCKGNDTTLRAFCLAILRGIIFGEKEAEVAALILLVDLELVNKERITLRFKSGREWTGEEWEAMDKVKAGGWKVIG